ncbi:pseudouridine synthase [Marinilactibacillus psychrotolerans]|uniref:Pseudouridine synthase n=2 Tax=Marinilactibacillus psychrotolerans TaxID=191770 RepID=A0A511H0Y7_9LACT|nr:pseudouridine synthase [Marinilactibacillus psychrotolerans]TLQ07097.1 rRNA pseudouridine synthase [Marinilactibacillus psychrotolerans]SDC59012.1 23S rRNA pseudouridine2605 synthase [Marinilactibacillus psychrotolerans]SJN34584.1 Ribosomal large subunit pseudouridine synthase B [Marinilactibacillus psychrotolerans 42ea]GEL67191.1 pseudouridine synthase [Marinilactibacillus psychrotolerans]GEQ34107.1 ribosomal large subunit pseudouridine synthase B [Marinilactibacillus psychrotolerans]
MERLQKVMAHAGIASRRKSESMIEAGRVKVNGDVITELGFQVKRSDTIEVDSVPIQKEKLVYFLLNKPRGVVSTASDPKNRETVVDLLHEVEERIYPVGRLDYDTTGVLLLTNDGELANKLMHPKYAVEKTYLAKVKGRVTREDIRQLEKGVVFDKVKSAPAKARITNYDRKKDYSTVELTIHEGKNHQVKKMMKAINHPIEKLTRTQYGFLSVEGMQSGVWRELKQFEINKLQQLVEDE